MKRHLLAAFLAIMVLFGSASAVLHFGVGSVSALDSQIASAVWSKTYEVPGYVGAYDVIEANDGGFVAIVSGVYVGSTYGFSIVKTDADGNMQWNRTYTAPGYYAAFPKSIILTEDGGYAIVGSTGYSGDKYGRVWLVKTDADGNMQWDAVIGDSLGVSEANCIIPTSDGGYAIAGDYAVYNGPGGWNFLFAKVDSSGNVQWTKTYGGPDDDRAYSVVQTSDGGFALAGCSATHSNLTFKFWLIKADSAGNMQWNKTYGDSGWRWAYSMVQTNDGGYALVGSFGSLGNDAGTWLVKTDSAGDMQWSKVFAENQGPSNSLIQTSDGGYAIAGPILYKTDSEGNIQWIYDSGKSATSAIETSDGCYVIVGQTSGNNGYIYMWAAKIAPSGLASSTPAPSRTPAQSPLPFPSPTPSPSIRNASILDVSCQSSATGSGFKVEINGNLTSNGLGIPESPVFLSYSVNGGKSWIDLTTVSTDSNGHFVAAWFATVSGTYLLRAEWMGNSLFLNDSKTISLAVLPYEEQNIFSVSSNSTVTAFAFNSTSHELSFVVSGESGTHGYVNVYIPKSLLTDVSDLRVYLDGIELTYSHSPQDDSWLIYFTYHHSTHQVTMNLEANSAALPLIVLSVNNANMWVICTATIVSAAILAVLMLVRKRKIIRTREN